MSHSLRNTLAFPLAPLRVFLLILIVVFAAEAGVMVLLPILLPADGDRLVEALVDACLLTVGLAPVLWRLVVFPLRRLVEGRTELLKRILSAQENEQRRLARDLHDEIGQALTSLLVGLRTLEESPTFEAAQERAHELRQVGREIHDELRRLAHGLRPTVLDDLGLAHALARYAEDYEQTHGVALRVHLPETKAGRLPEAVETSLYRIAQEALTNVARHAGARHVQLELMRSPTLARLTVTDDGCGFDPTAERRQPGKAGHFGLSGMAERAALLNGSFAVRSWPGAGTTLTAEIPLEGMSDGKDSRGDRG